MALKRPSSCELAMNPALVSQSAPSSGFREAPAPGQSSRSICEHWRPPHLPEIPTKWPWEREEKQVWFFFAILSTQL